MYYTYILENNAKTLLYIGTTTDLAQVIKERKSGERHFVEFSNLVYYEVSDDEATASEKEKALKGLTRRARQKLIEAFNPKETDLSSDFLN